MEFENRFYFKFYFMLKGYLCSFCFPLNSFRCMNKERIFLAKYESRLPWKITGGTITQLCRFTNKAIYKRDAFL